MTSNSATTRRTDLECRDRIIDAAATLDGAFESPEGAALMANARVFIAEITTLLVERHVIVE